MRRRVFNLLCLTSALLLLGTATMALETGFGHAGLDLDINHGQLVLCSGPSHFWILWNKFDEGHGLTLGDILKARGGSSSWKVGIPYWLILLFSALLPA